MKPQSLALDSGDFIISDFEKKIIIKLSKQQQTDISKFRTYNAKSIPTTISKEEYLNTCKSIIENIKAKNFSKVVLSRVIERPIKKPIHQILIELCQHYPKAFIYAISLENIGTWIGASPESFLQVNNDQVKTTALAGTKINHDIPWEAKEKDEQAIVTEFIEDKLNMVGAENIKKEGPYTFNTGALLHLKTDFSARVLKEKQFQLINHLHPTPATCGMPQKKALAYIKSIEKHDRLFYTGFIGTINNHNADLFVNLRCMQIVGDKAYLYVGGGITKDSNPELEWEETVNKSKTLGAFLD